MKARVKICGLTRAEDARLACKLGATHVGSVMVESSPRSSSLEQAKAVNEASLGATHVLVFKNAPTATILAVARSVGTSHVQLYDAGISQATRLEEEGLTVYRVFCLEPDARRLPALSPPPTATRPAVLDVGGGGSGTHFSWEILGARAPRGTFIAGGIRPENVADLMAHRPYGVDLSSGVERSPGVKDRERLEQLFVNIESSEQAVFREQRT